MYVSSFYVGVSFLQNVYFLRKVDIFFPISMQNFMFDKIQGIQSESSLY